MPIPFLGTAAGEVAGPVGGAIVGNLGRAGTKRLLNAAGITNPVTRNVAKFLGTAAGHVAGSLTTKAACHAVTLDAVGASTALPTLGVGKSTLDAIAHATVKALPKQDQARLGALNVMQYLDGGSR